MTDKIYECSTTIKQYFISDVPDVDLTTENVQTFDHLTVEVVDSVDTYLELMKSLFDFNKMKELVKNGFKLRVDCLSGSVAIFLAVAQILPGVAGPYAKRIFVDELGANPADVVNCDPLPDFGGTKLFFSRLSICPKVTILIPIWCMARASLMPWQRANMTLALPLTEMRWVDWNA